MNLTMSYLGRSGLRSDDSGRRILQMAPNLARDAVALDAPLIDPLRFREAISALHDVVINDLTFKPRDKTAYDQWRAGQAHRERAIRVQAHDRAREQLREMRDAKPSAELKTDYSRALKSYWRSRRELDRVMKREDPALWRKLMPYDPVITVADDVVFFECFSADESSYGCLTVDRDSMFGQTGQEQLGTTNVDYSWDLYNNFQTLRTYRETRFNVDPTGFEVKTSEQPNYREEKIELPDGWLHGFMQLQSAMGLPTRRVTLSVSAVYSLLAFLKRNKARTSPRAIRFELADGAAPRMVLEPWERVIESPETTYHGPNDEPIRIWGRRRLLTLARVLPLARQVDVHLLGVGLPSFWVVHMGNMRLTLGLSGWTTNDWTRGSAVQMLLPHTNASDRLVANTAELLSQQRALSLSDISITLKSPSGAVASALNQLALRGQVIHDLHADLYRWRQVLPMELSGREIGPPHPETLAARKILSQKKLQLTTRETGPRGGVIVAGNAEGKPCEALIDGDGMVRRGKCLCSWHFRYGIRNGPCRHIQALRDLVWLSDRSDDDDWFERRMKWAGR